MGNISSTPSYFNTPQTGAQYRVTPQNYRQILGDQADIVMKPEQMKDMFEKGYLDVQRQFTEQESNEGIFTIAAKAIATFVGPSRSIGAISIDPKFLEMIKDPNAEIGFGYTRLRQETLNSLPYPTEPERPATPPPAQTTPSLQQTDVGVATPQEQTEEHREQTAKFRKEQEARTETPGTPGSYMVERNSRQNNAGVTWGKDGGAKGSDEFGTLVKKYEADGAPQYWNTEYVQDATWEGAYTEAATQDRDTAVRFQYATRGGLDMETAISERKSNPNADTVATRQTQVLLNYVNKKTGSHLTMNDVMRNPQGVKEQIAKAYGFPNNAEVSRLAQHSRDFRAIGYISGENPKVATHQVGQMSTGQANSILRQQITGHSKKSDNTDNFYDTIGMLSSRKVSEPGFDAFKPADATASTTLLDVYRTQTQTTPIPDNAMGDYQKLYNDRFKTNLSLDDIKAAKPTLQDMYALRASNFYATNSPGKNKDGDPLPLKPLPITPNNGRVTLNNPGQDTNRMLNVRMVLEANNGGDQMHTFGPTEIAAVNARVTQNFTGSTLTLRNNLGQTVPADQLIQRLQINNQDSEAVDTAMVELNRTGVLKAAGSNEIIAKFDGEPRVLQKPDGKGGFEPVKPEDQAAFLSQAAQQFTKPDGSYNSQLDGGVGHGFVGGTAGTTQVTRTNTPPVTIKASEMLQLASGNADSNTTVKNLKESLGITGEISQQDLFKRVLTDAFGQTPDQAATALTAATGTTASRPQFEFPQPNPAANSGVQFGDPSQTTFTPVSPTSSGVIKTESSTSVSGPSVESRTASLNANLKTMGELAQIQNLIPKNPESIGQLKTQIVADLDALEKTGVTSIKIGTPPTDTPISTIRASVTESFGKIEASAQKGKEAMRMEAVRRGLGEDADPSQVIGQAPGGLPPIPPVPADGKAGGAAYATSIQDSVKAFSGQLREMVRDGDISETEKASIQGWLDTSTQNLATSLGLAPNTLQGSNLAETLRGKGYSDADINTISNAVGMIKDAQASTNLTSEARSFHKVLDNVRGLQQKLDEFEKVGVLRNAFVGEMKDLATKKPEQFDAVMRGAYNLPPKGQDPKADAVIADLTTQAKEGRMPIPANISFVDGNTLHGANAAYIPPQTGADGKKVEGTILLNRALLTKPAELSNALAEEMFHHMEGQTQAFRAGEALAKLPADAQTALKAKPDAVLSEQQVSALTSDQKQAYDDYLKARSGTYDTVGDEGQAGLRAFREAQQGGSVATISAVAAQGRDALASEGVLKSGTGDRPTNIKGYDHGTVTLPGAGALRAEFQSGGVRRGGSTDTQTEAPPITPGETGGLATPGINPHNTGQTYVMPTQSDPMPPTSDPIELRRREHIQSLDRQLSTFQTTEHKNADGSPMTEPQKEQKRLNLQKERDELVQLNSVQYAQKYNVQQPAGSTHQMEQPPEDFWGKAKEMGGQAINGILQALSTGAFGALCDRIASQIESVWGSFYAERAQNSIASDNTKANELAGVTMGSGARSSDSLSKSAQGEQMLQQSMQDYQQKNPGFRQNKGPLGEADDADERHRKSFNRVFGGG